MSGKQRSDRSAAQGCFISELSRRDAALRGCLELKCYQLTDEGRPDLFRQRASRRWLAFPPSDLALRV